MTTKQLKSLTHFIVILFIFLMAFMCLRANAQIQEGARQYIFDRNVLVNPGFENSTKGWTASAGSLALASSGSNKLTGNASGTWDASATSQTLTQTVAVSNALKGQNCVAKLFYLGGDGNLSFSVTDGTNNLAAAVTLVAASTPRSETIFFICPSSGNIQFKLASSADAAIIALDNLYMGEASPFIANVSQAQFVGSAYYPTTTSCSWSRTNTAFGAFTADTDCPAPTVEATGAGGWTISTTDNNLPQITVNNLPDGIYIVESTFPFYAGTGIASGARLSDGTTTSGDQSWDHDNAGVAGEPITIVGYFTYSVAGNRTFALHGKTSSGAGDIDLGGSGRQLSFKIYRYPTASETALRPELSNPVGNLKYAGATNCSWSLTDASFANFAADTDCNAPTVSGSASAPGTKIPGAVFSNLSAGSYMAVASGSFAADYSGSNTSCGFAISDGSSKGGYTEINAISTLTSNVIPALVGVFNYSANQPSLTFQIQAVRLGGGGSCQIINASTNRQFEITLIPLSLGIKAPLLVGSVTSNSSGLERIESAEINCDAGSAITSQSGSWVSAVGNRSTTTCALTLTTGIFSTLRACVVTVKNSTVQAMGSVINSATSVNIYGPNADYDAYVICMGSR